MFLMIKQISIVSIICGISLSLAPDGSVKRMMNILCSVILISMIASSVADFCFEAYSLDIARIKEREDSLLKSSRELEDKLNRNVIEQQCEAYIVDKAEELGMGQIEAKVGVRWSSEGFWLPEYAEIKQGYNASLSEYIESELGIAAEKQKWC